MKKGLTILALILLGYFVIGRMSPDFEEVSNIREDNGLIALVFFTGPDTYVYREDEPHAVYVEVKDKKFVWWKFKYKYEVRYVPFTDGEKHRTWDPDLHRWGTPLDDIIYLDDIF